MVFARIGTTGWSKVIGLLLRGKLSKNACGEMRYPYPDEYSTRSPLNWI